MELSSTYPLEVVIRCGRRDGAFTGVESSWAPRPIGRCWIRMNQPWLIIHPVRSLDAVEEVEDVLLSEEPPYSARRSGDRVLHALPMTAPCLFGTSAGRYRRNHLHTR